MKTQTTIKNMFPLEPDTTTDIMAEMTTINFEDTTTDIASTAADQITTLLEQSLIIHHHSFLTNISRCCSVLYVRNTKNVVR